MNVPNPQGGSNFTPGVQGFRRVPLEDRFWAKVNKQDGDDACWLWTGALRGSPGKQKGYAEIFVDGRPRPASQVSWELEQGQPFPAGLPHLRRTALRSSESHLPRHARRQRAGRCAQGSLVFDEAQAGADCGSTLGSRSRRDVRLDRSSARRRPHDSEQSGASQDVDACLKREKENR